MSDRMRRGGRILVVVAIILFFAVSVGSAGSYRTDTGRDPSVPMSVIKVPVTVIKTIAVTEARLEQHVRSSLHHAGVEALLRAIHWFARGARTAGERAGMSPER